MFYEGGGHTNLKLPTKYRINHQNDRIIETTENQNKYRASEKKYILLVSEICNHKSIEFSIFCTGCL